MAWQSQKVLCWWLSDAMDASFHVEALKHAKVKICTDGRGLWNLNRMIEWLPRSLKYECVDVVAVKPGTQAHRRPDQPLQRKPSAVIAWATEAYGTARKA